MRTTIQIDNDVMEAARRLARQRGSTIGKVISELVRAALNENTTPRKRNGVPLFARKVASVRPDANLVNRLRDES